MEDVEAAGPMVHLDKEAPAVIPDAEHALVDLHLGPAFIKVLSPWRAICGEAKGEILDLLTGTEGEVLPLLAQSLQQGTANAVDADARCGDGVPRLLGRLLVRERSAHLWRYFGDDGLERAPVVCVREIAVLGGVPELARLHLHLHEQAPLMVVGLG
jgi:hypothetical protein